MTHNTQVKRPVITGLSFFLALLLLTAFPLCCSAVEVKTGSSDQVAASDEMAPAQTVGREDMTPIYGSQIPDGTYDISVESSSSMFRITKCLLTVADGVMTADMTLGGKGYLRLYMGTGEEAAAADAASYAEYQEAVDGSYYYTVPVEALDKVIPCAAFSERKEKWYDRQLVFSSSDLPEGTVTGGDAGLDVSENPNRGGSGNGAEEALSVEEEASLISTGPSAGSEDAGYAACSLKDGTYLIEVELEGGSGRATVESPTEMVVKDGKADITITWSSPNYDYMIVNGIRYEPVNESGNSRFVIPVTKFDGGMEVVGDTTAMSTPHEIAYTLNIRTDTAERQGLSRTLIILFVLVIAAIGFAIGIIAGRYIARNRLRFSVLKDDDSDAALTTDSEPGSDTDSPMDSLSDPDSTPDSDTDSEPVHAASEPDAALDPEPAASEPDAESAPASQDTSHDNQ